MTKRICEKAIFNVLFYRNYKMMFSHSGWHSMNEIDQPISKIKWVKSQSDKIDRMGFDKWYNTTDGPRGDPNKACIFNKSGQNRCYTQI